MDRTEIVKRMVEKGLTYQFDGEIFGISRQRAHQLATGYKPDKKRYRKAHPEQVRAARQRYMAKRLMKVAGGVE